MADFDEKEAEAIASNWVQNLRFRFARMGLSYGSEATDVRNGSDSFAGSKRKSTKVEERSSSVGKSLGNKGEVIFSDLRSKQNGSLKTFRPQKPSDLLLEGISSGDKRQCVLPSTRSDKSKVNLESLRKKRLNFFQQQTSLSTSKCENTELHTNNRNVVSKRCEFENEGCDTFAESSLSNGMQSLSENSNFVDEEADPESINSTNEKGCKNIAWGGNLKFDVVDKSEYDKPLTKFRDDSVLCKLDEDSSDVFLTTGHMSQAIRSVSSETLKVTAKNCDNVNNRKNCSFGRGLENLECKDLLQVFPIELDEEVPEERTRIDNSEDSLGRLCYSSDSESDYTVDDPVSKHASTRTEDSRVWGHLCRHSDMSSLAQSASPPAPQITGALYHEFDSSDQELDCDTSNIVCKNYISKACQRPRSLSHPSTVRDCSEMYESFCCVNTRNSIDVVCNVSSRKECVDVKISYSDENKDILSNGWFSSSQHCVSKEHDAGNNFRSNSHEKQCTAFSKSPDNSVINGSFQKEKSDKISEDFFDVCLCPECDEINRTSGHWCSECGAVLSNPKPISSKSIDLYKQAEQTGKPLPIPKSQADHKMAESSKTYQLQSSSMPKANTKSHSQLAAKKPKHNGRHWEKSNLPWSTFKDNNFSKPSSKKNSRNHPRKSGIAEESVEVPRPRSTSCKNTGKQVKAVDNEHVPGSLPRSYKFKEFKKKKGSLLGNGAGNLALEGTKATGKQTSQVKDSSKCDDMNEKIRRNCKKPLPYLCLPDEIILRVFGHLTHAELARCSCVCQQLNRIAQDEILWRTIILKRNQNISDAFLEKIGSKKPVSLSLIKCHGNLVTSSGLRELFRGCADSLEELNFIGCSGGQLIGESILLHVALRCNKLRSVDVSWSNVGDNGVEALVLNVERWVHDLGRWVQDLGRWVHNLGKWVHYL